MSLNQSKADNEVKEIAEEISLSEEKLASLEEKFVLNEIEKDSYTFMKPKFKAEMKN